MNKKFRKLILPVSILAASQAYALGLGDLQVNSALDQVLDGQIPIIVDVEEDITNIKVALASSDDYKRVDLDKSYVPTNIHVDIVDENDRKYIVVSSRGPISEPIVSLLISVDWANGHLLREYTILLDPPLFNTSQTQQNYSDPVQTETYKAPAKIDSEKQTIPTNNTNQSSSRTGNKQVVVEAGDTLWKIAGDINQGYGSQQQMMVALFNNNPTAFTNNDMNRLKKGAILDVPKADDVTMISNGEAVAEVRSHLQNWSNLQTQDSGTSSNDSGSSVDYGIELIPPSDSDSTNSNNTSGSSRDSANRNRAELSRLKEELASSNLENDELASRVFELEQLVKDQELALNLKDNSLAQLQQQIKDADDAIITDATSGETIKDDVWDDTTQDSMADTASDDSIIKDTDSAAMTEDVSTTEDIVLSDTLSNEDSETVSLKDNVDEQNDTSTLITTTTTPAAEKSIIDKILDYKFEALIGLGALILAGLAFIFVRRRKSEADNSEVGGFLDSISNNSDKLEEETLEEHVLDDDNDLGDDIDLDDDNEFSELNDSDITETDLSNQDIDELLDDDQINETEVPEVIVMDDQSEEENTDDSDDEISLDIEDFDLDDINLDDSEIDSELADLDFSETDSDDESDDDDELEIDDLSLDLDMDDLDLSNDTEETEEHHADETQEEDEEEFSLDIDIDSEIETEEAEEDFSLDLDFDTENMEFEVDDSPVESELDDTSEESELVDLDLTSEESIINIDDSDDSKNEVNETLEFDLSDDLYDSDDLSFDSDDQDSSETDEYESVSIETDESEEFDIGLDLDDIIDDDAIDTKLDLAKAYFEMGDVDGAKQMVIEIIEEGSDEQKSKAEELKKEIEG